MWLEQRADGGVEVGFREAEGGRDARWPGHPGAPAHGACEEDGVARLPLRQGLQAIKPLPGAGLASTAGTGNSIPSDEILPAGRFIYAPGTQVRARARL